MGRYEDGVRLKKQFGKSLSRPPGRFFKARPRRFQVSEPYWIPVLELDRRNRRDLVDPVGMRRAGFMRARCIPDLVYSSCGAWPNQTLTRWPCLPLQAKWGVPSGGPQAAHVALLVATSLPVRSTCLWRRTGRAESRMKGTQAVPALPLLGGGQEE